MASPRLPLLLPLLLVLAFSLAPSLSLHGSAVAHSISGIEVSDSDIDSYLRGSASNEGDSAAVAVPAAEEHEGRKLQQQVACGKDSIRITNRFISDNMNGSATYQLFIKNICPEDVIGRLVFWNCDIDSIFSAGNLNFQTGKPLFNSCCKPRGRNFCELAVNTAVNGVQLPAGREFKVLYMNTKPVYPCVQQLTFRNGRMASSRLPLLLPLLLVLGLSVAPSLSTHGSALAPSISASDVSDGDIDRYVSGIANSEAESTAVAVPGAEEHVRRSLQRQQVSCDQNSILVTNRVVSDQGNGTKVVQLHQALTLQTFHSRTTTHGAFSHSILTFSLVPLSSTIPVDPQRDSEALKVALECLKEAGSVTAWGSYPNVARRT
ncbi:unnamed protein product, partial [Closterium sp. NIES-54]